MRKDIYNLSVNNVYALMFSAGAGSFLKKALGLASVVTYYSF